MKTRKISEFSVLKFLKLPLVGRKVSRKQLSLFCRQLSVMLDAGLPLLSGLKILREQTDNIMLKNTLYGVCCRLEEGQNFSEALSRYPEVFPGILVTMVAAGEAGGVLDNILENVAGFLEWEHRIYEKVKASLIYPLIVLGISVLAVTFIVMFILPVFGRVLEQMNVEIPLITRILLGLSQILRNYWFIIVCFLAAMILGFIRARKNNARLREITDVINLKVPVFGNITKKIIVARFCRTMATLLQVGVPVLPALEIVEKTTGNSIVEKSIALSRKNIFDGQGMAEPLRQSGVFSPLVIEMMVVGEETGALAPMLAKAGAFYDEEVDNFSAKLTTLLEPFLICIVGAVVCVVLLSVFLPMFKVIGNVG